MQAGRCPVAMPAVPSGQRLHGGQSGRPRDTAGLRAPPAAPVCPPACLPACCFPYAPPFHCSHRGHPGPGMGRCCCLCGPADPAALDDRPAVGHLRRVDGRRPHRKLGPAAQCGAMDHWRRPGPVFHAPGGGTDWGAVVGHRAGHCVGAVPGLAVWRLALPCARAPHARCSCADAARHQLLCRRDWCGVRDDLVVRARKRAHRPGGRQPQPAAAHRHGDHSVCAAVQRPARPRYPAAHAAGGELAGPGADGAADWGRGAADGPAGPRQPLVHGGDARVHGPDYGRPKPVGRAPGHG